MRVCGPSLIQTLRGRLLGREVVLMCCGEAHEDAIDLTRSRCIVEPLAGWVEVQKRLPQRSIAQFSDRTLTIERALTWARRKIEKLEEDEDEDEDDGADCGFLASYDPGDLMVRLFRGSITKAPDLAMLPDEGLRTFEWRDDLDSEAHSYNRRRLDGEEVPVAVHDALIAERKKALQAENIELFDDWLCRAVRSAKAEQPSRADGATAETEDTAGSPGQGRDTAVSVQLIVEMPVRADEVELHVEPGKTELPVAAECIRLIESDSDTDSDDEHDPDDGTGSFLEYDLYIYDRV